MEKDLKRHFRELIEPLFTSHAELRERRGDKDICIDVDWKLQNDASRPNKRSKTIRIRISREAIEDYTVAGEQHRRAADERLKKVVVERLNAFDPEHNNPVDIPHPVEEWIITTQILNA